ncbi:MAG: exopolysaccharide biosynthesis polyprenyl glycosylphosphotransferase [Erysipelotrichaceae bacterium]|nr:exopolysaccharide biosynthesis polyprenyl glycosylphosphotransferase [Erysipelotrichaceae bacterium]MBQ6494208.1 exopolysaccharide biosynthesis polyprenyl glycosylphosphotransferase [Erysipelotrichaceae bacterium]
MTERFNNKENAKIALGLANTFVYEIIFLATLMMGYTDYFFYYSNGYILFFGIYLAFFIVFGRLFSSFSLGDATTTDLFLSHVLTHLFTDFMIYLVLCLITLRPLPVWPILILLIVQIIIAAFLLYIENRYIRRNFPPVRVVAIYGESHYNLIGKLNNINDLSINVIRTVDLKDINYRKIDETLKDADGVVTLDVHHENKKKIFKACYERKLLIYDVPSITDMLLASSDILHMVDTPILKINKFGPSQIERLFKRLIDIIGSLILIVITSPIMLLVAIAIKIQDGGDVFYKQVRLTKNEREFKIIKFRSMVMNAEKNTGVVLAKENDDRITPVGKFIRKVRFDELPQLINILNGDMSFVGPRPERPEIYDKICKNMPEFRYRLVVKAGLTGYAQVYGKYNTSLRDKLLLDLYYIENYSIIDDIKLILLTVKILFNKEATEGITEENEEEGTE